MQFAKIFSNWYVTKGKDPNGNDILIRVPIMYGDSSRQASTIIANNSASNLPSAPLITYYISGLEYAMVLFAGYTFGGKFLGVIKTIGTHRKEDKKDELEG